MNQTPKGKKLKPPFGDRKRGERAAKGLVPPFHPKGKDHREYKSNWSKS